MTAPPGSTMGLPQLPWRWGIARVLMARLTFFGSGRPSPWDKWQRSTSPIFRRQPARSSDPCGAQQIAYEYDEWPLILWPVGSDQPRIGSAFTRRASL